MMDEKQTVNSLLKTATALQKAIDKKESTEKAIAETLATSFKAFKQEVRGEVSRINAALPDKGDKGDKGPKGDKGDKGSDGRNGLDGKDGKDGKDGSDGTSVVNAFVDFDGSLVLELSDGTQINAGDVSSEDKEAVFATLKQGASTLNELLPTQTGNSGKYLTTNGTATSWATVSGSGDVVGPASATNNNIALFDGTTGKLIKQSSALTFDGTNLGLGVTPSAWGGVLSKALELTGGVYFTAYNNSSTQVSLYLGANNYYNGSSYLYSTSRAATQYQQVDGAHLWFTAPSGTAGNAISFTQAMTLDASGNLVVGGTSALISGAGRGNITINGSSNAILTFGIGGSAQGYIYHYGTGMEIVNQTNTPLTFSTNNSERARITSGGELLVGLTSATGVALLQVSGPIRTTGYTVATLPAGTVGMRTYVTDALAPSFGVAVAGSGAVTIPVFYDGANWIVA
jgi:hypothetical protein